MAHGNLDLTVYWIYEEGWILAAFQYDEELKEAIKASIPYHMRKWNPDRKVWCFNPLAWDHAVRVFELYGYIVPADPANVEPVPKSAVVLSGPYAVLGVADDAPMEVINAVYKALARLYHPDTPDGDVLKMAKVNDAMDVIRKMRGVV